MSKSAGDRIWPVIEKLSKTDVRGFREWLSNNEKNDDYIIDLNNAKRVEMCQGRETQTKDKPYCVLCADKPEKFTDLPQGLTGKGAIALFRIENSFYMVFFALYTSFRKQDKNAEAFIETKKDEIKSILKDNIKYFDLKIDEEKAKLNGSAIQRIMKTSFFGKKYDNSQNKEEIISGFNEMIEFYKEYLEKDLDREFEEKYQEIEKTQDRTSKNNKANKKTRINAIGVDQLFSDAIKNDKQIILTGAPGTGKTFSIREWMKANAEGRWEFVQFHPSYDYTDFVEGLRPAHIEGTKKDEISFVRVDGVFKSFCRQIVGNNDGKDYYFVIDEINRADLSKVFGELMFALEEDYRGAKNHFPTQYSNLTTYEYLSNGNAKPIENDCFKDGFFIPENLYIIGTMNDIDRSVESFDFALRRRFKWIEIKANDVMLEALRSMEIRDEDLRCDKDGKPEDETLLQRILTMNEYLAKKSDLGLNEHYCIGPAYFKFASSKGEIDIAEIWRSRVKPILIEYCRGKGRDASRNFINDCRDIIFGTERERKREFHEWLKKHGPSEDTIKEYIATLEVNGIFKLSNWNEAMIRAKSLNEDPEIRKQDGRNPETGVQVDGENNTMMGGKLRKGSFNAAVGYLKKYVEFVNELNGDFDGEESANIIDVLDDNEAKQIVFTGAPGTSKTYSVRKWLEGRKRKGNAEGEKDLQFKENEDYVFVQFHPSYDYTDFVEGLRPITKDGQTTFARVDGTFKDFCRKVVSKNILGIKGDSVDEKIEKLFDGDKSACKQWEKALNDRYYFVIDEINRADLSKVFGELMFALENSYRGVKNRFDTQYQNLKTFSVDKGDYIGDKEDCFKNGFFVPENIYIIGTMNDIDRSVETFDFALRRRFKWVNIDADFVMKSVLMDIVDESDLTAKEKENRKKEIPDICSRMKELNEKIANASDFGLNEDFRIGPAYLKNLALGKEDYDVVWDRRIEPLMKEYCRGRNADSIESFAADCKDIFLS